MLFLSISCYLVGSIPFGFLVTKYITGTDIRAIGSGNIGAKNVSRALGAKWGIVVFLLDAIKGSLAVIIAHFSVFQHINSQVSAYGLFLLFGGIISIVGHNWNCFLNFRGGKGLSTSIGAILTLSIFLPFLRVPVIIGVGMFIILFILLRDIFISAGLAIASFFMICLVIPSIHIEHKTLLFLYAFLFFLRHRYNLEVYMRTHKVRK